MAETRAYVAAWTHKRGGTHLVLSTISRTASEARAKAGAFWSGGWRYASRRQGWRIVPLNVSIDQSASVKDPTT
jgi:hypothetical protein